VASSHLHSSSSSRSSLTTFGRLSVGSTQVWVQQQQGATRYRTAHKYKPRDGAGSSSVAQATDTPPKNTHALPVFHGIRGTHVGS
jgi:hypothetical protein